MTGRKKSVRQLTWLWLSLLLLLPVVQSHPLHAQDERSREHQTEERKARDKKGRENESLNRSNDNVVDKDEKLAAREAPERDERLTREEAKKPDVENLNGRDDTLREEPARNPEELQRKQQRLRENYERGTAWEAKTAKYMEAKNGDRPGEQVTLEGKNGTRSRADIIYEDPNRRGQYILVECKASDKAKFTANQRDVFDSVRAGDEVTLRGKNFDPALDGKKIKISEVNVSRPDENGNVRTERYQGPGRDTEEAKNP